MNPGNEPGFLTREAVDAIHEDQIERFGGLREVRDDALESAIAAALNVYHYGSGDVYEIAAAYAFAALVFLEGSGIDAGRLPEDQTYDLMIRIAAHEASRGDFADYLRSELGR